MTCPQWVADAFRGACIVGMLVLTAIGAWTVIGWAERRRKR